MGPARIRALRALPPESRGSGAGGGGRTPANSSGLPLRTGWEGESSGPSQIQNGAGGAVPSTARAGS